jgi:hypothetical protein
MEPRERRVEPPRFVELHDGDEEPLLVDLAASAERTWPPMSAVWHVEAKGDAVAAPEHRVQMVTSLRWPEAFQGRW